MLALVNTRQKQNPAELQDVNEQKGQYDLILESVGGSSLAAAIRLVAPNGTIIVFGNSSNEDTTINFTSFVGHSGARIQGFFSYLAAPPEATGPDLARLVSLIDVGKLTPEIGMERSWRELA